MYRLLGSISTLTCLVLSMAAQVPEAPAQGPSAVPATKEAPADDADSRCCNRRVCAEAGGFCMGCLCV